jgi:hypothetical protein
VTVGGIAPALRGGAISIAVAGSLAIACSGDEAGQSRVPVNEAPAPPPSNTPPPPTTPAAEPPPARPPQVPPPPPAQAGPCGDNCTERTIGGDGDGFDLDVNPNDAVEIDADGALVVTRRTGETASYIWIADTTAQPPTIAKIDTRAQTIVARYAVGAPDPSRTSLAMNGDAYVASRAGMGVTKISTLGADCPDTNGDGMVTTSSGPNDVLPFGEDDCVLWFRKFDQEIRGVAAQDIPAHSVIEPQPDGPPKITTTPAQHYVWVGASTVGYDPVNSPMSGAMAPRAYKLDGETGEILIDTEMPRGAYGFALDGRGILWLTGGAYWNGSLAFIDTTQCVDDASCDVEPCRVTCSASACPTTCDGAVKADITLDPYDAYGITVDCKQRVWLGSLIKRYDPQAPADQRFKVTTAMLTNTSFVAGIAADAHGWVWGAGTNNHVLRIDAETMQQAAEIPVPQSTQGVAVDIDGKIWAIPMSTSVHVITPGDAVADNAVQTDAVTGLQSPYTYSDMTGVQQILAANAEPGMYSRVFEGCAEDMATTWADFSYDAETPDGTRIVFQARTADTIAGLESALWQPLAGAPSDTPEAQLGTTLMLSGEPPGRYVEIKVDLYMDPGATDRCTETSAVTPKLKSFTVSFSCPVVERGPG